MITLTGGEPFISKNVEQFLMLLTKNRSTKNMSLRFFTNLTKVPNWLEGVLNQFKFIEVIASIDAAKELASYIRYPSEWIQIKTNIQKVIELINNRDKVELSIHCVIQLYNFSQLETLINELKFFEESLPFIPSFTLLEHPTFLKAENLPDPFFSKSLKKNIDFAKSIDIPKNKFEFVNNKNLKNFINLLSSLEANGGEFIMALTHTKKLDKIRGQNIYDFLPELKELK